MLFLFLASSLPSIQPITCAQASQQAVAWAGRCEGDLMDAGTNDVGYIREKQRTLLRSASVHHLRPQSQVGYFAMVSGNDIEAVIMVDGSRDTHLGLWDLCCYNHASGVTFLKALKKGAKSMDLTIEPKYTLASKWKAELLYEQ